MSNFKISKLEHLFVQELNKQFTQIPPLSINKKLYEFACNHAKDLITKKIKNVKGGTRERRNNFPTAKRYREICFVSPISSSNLDDETAKALSSMIMSHYATDLKIGVNSIGPALIPLKSNKILVIILLAFFQPYVTVTKFNQEFEPLSKQKARPDDKSHLVDLFNRFRALANFDKLNTKPREPTSLSFCFDRYHCRTIVSYSIQLFQRLMSDFKLYDILIDYWTNFSIETTPDPDDNSKFLLSLKFWRFDSYLDYKVDVTVIPPKDRKNDVEQEKKFNDISVKPEDITTRGAEIQPIIDDIASTEVIKNRLNQQIKDLNDQAKRDAEGLIAAQMARENFAQQEAEAYQEAKEARELKEQYEDQASKSAAIAHQATNSLEQANQNAVNAQQRAVEAAAEAAKLQDEAEAQDALYHESERIKQEAEMKEKEAEEKEQKALDAANIIEREAQDQIELAKQIGNSSDVIAAVHNQEVVERKVDDLLQIAEDAQKEAKNEEEIINKAETVAQEALENKNKLIDEIQKQNQIQEEQQIIQEAESSKIPEYSSIAEEAMQQAEIFENAAEREAEIARAADEAEKEAIKKKNAANLVSAALQRSANLLESKAEVVEVAEEVFNIEESNELDFGVDKIDNNAIESETTNIIDSSYEPVYQEHDGAIDKDNLSVYDFIASNENGFVKDDLENFDFNEAMAMLKAENVDDNIENDNVVVKIEIPTEEEAVNETQNLYVFEARDNEVDPVLDPESAKETELANNSDVPYHIQSEAAKELEDFA